MTWYYTSYSAFPRNIRSSLFEVIAVIGVIETLGQVYISRNIRSSLFKVIAVIGVIETLGHVYISLKISDLYYLR